MNPIGTVATCECLFDVDNYFLADGRTLLIVEYPELFAVIGTRFGGDGMVDFKIPLVDEASDVMRFVIKYR
jgi:microcystin-dependent protein